MKVLVITYYWPPSGGAAVQRWLSFANKLAADGIAVHVLTVNPKYATFQLVDESLVRDVHPAVRVHTTKTVEPFGLFTLLFGKKSLPKPAFANETNPSFTKKLSRFIRGNVFIPDPRKGWKRFAVKKATQLLNQEQFDCVITAGPPHSTHFIGEALKKKLGIYWIADFHDLWTDVIYYDMLYHLPFVKRIDKALERRILLAADRIITVGEKYKEKLLPKSDMLAAEKIAVLRIGYDEALFPAPKEAAETAEFIITYTGTLADYYQPQVFVAALKTVVERFPAVPFRLRFAGVLSGDVKASIVAAGLRGVLEECGYVRHRESIALLLKSTVLLLVNPVTKDEDMVIPGKLYEYLAAGKPIINITKPTAETAAIIDACGAGRTFGRNQQAELEAYLTELVHAWKKEHSLDITGNEERVAAYSRGAIATQLKALLNRKA